MMPVTSLSRSPESFETELQKAKTEAVDTINEAVGEIRKKYITTIPGQDMLYKSKEAEARVILESNDPETLDPDDFPFISSEVGVNGNDLVEVANLVMSLSQQWTIVGSQLENVRLSYVKVVKVSTTVSEIETAVQAFRNQVSVF